MRTRSIDHGAVIVGEERGQEIEARYGMEKMEMIIRRCHIFLSN